MLASVLDWHEQCMLHVTHHHAEVSLTYESSVRDVYAFSDRLERQGRIAIIDDAIGDIKAHFLGIFGGVASSSSSQLSWGVSEHVAAAKAVKQRRVKQLEDANNLLQRKYETVRLERDHFASGLAAAEKKVLDGVRSVNDASRLRAENAKLLAAVQKLSATRAVVRNQASQTTEHELEVVTLRRQARLIQFYNFELQEQLGRTDISSEFAESVHRLHEFFLQIKHQERTVSIKRLQKGAATIELENQMLHEELSLCLRRIAKLEAAQGITSTHQPRQSSEGDDNDPTKHSHMESQTDEDCEFVDQLIANVSVLELEQRKLRLLLTKFVGVVAAEAAK